MTRAWVKDQDVWPPEGYMEWRRRKTIGCNPLTLSDGEVEDLLDAMESSVTGNPESHVLMVGLGDHIALLRWVDRHELTDLLAAERSQR